MAVAKRSWAKSQSHSAPSITRYTCLARPNPRRMAWAWTAVPKSHGRGFWRRGHHKLLNQHSSSALSGSPPLKSVDDGRLDLMPEDSLSFFLPGSGSPIRTPFASQPPIEHNHQAKLRFLRGCHRMRQLDLLGS